MRVRLESPQAMATLLAVLALALGCRAGEAPAPTADAAAYTPPRTSDGQPDMQGMWLPWGYGPMETPSGERWVPPPGSFEALNASRTQNSRESGQGNLLVANQSGPPMVVDPPDGKIPLQPWAAAKRDEIMKHQEKLEYLDPRVRCLASGVPRVNLPVDYNSYQFMQIPGYVVLLYEWNHLYRLIPLDGRPHVSPDIRLFMGDSRGHWEGNTLVVDVTNFTDKTWVVGHYAPPEGAPASSLTTGHGVFQSEALHVVERFTLVEPDLISYEATIEDPKVFTRPWTFRFTAFKRAPNDHMLFEYACHEGNRTPWLAAGLEPLFVK